MSFDKRCVGYLNNILNGAWNTSGLDVQWKIILDENQNPTLYFQYTTSKADWLENFKVWLAGIPRKPYKSMPKLWFAHTGFTEMWKSCREDIRSQLKCPPNRIVGFSQGSGLALLAAEDFYFTDGVMPETIAFGCPRVFWFPPKELSERLDVTRISTHNDLVTKIPLWLIGFVHVGTEHVIGPKRWFWSAKAHQPEYYLSILESYQWQ